MESKENQKLCSHKHIPEGSCKRLSHSSGSGYCAFHTPLRGASRVPDDAFYRGLYRLIKKGDTDWRGFVYPKSIKFERLKIPIHINTSHGKFGELTLKQCEFEHQVDLSNSEFSGDVTCSGSKFKESLSFKDSTFLGICHLTSLKVETGLQANTCHFKDDFLLSGTLKGNCNFNQGIFEKQARFTQTKSITVSLQSISMGMSSSAMGIVTLSNGDESALQLIWMNFVKLCRKYKSLVVNKLKQVGVKFKKKYVDTKSKYSNKYKSFRSMFPHKREGVEKHVLFVGEAHLQNIIFNEPNRVLFQGVDLTKASFGGTDLREVTFIGNDWFNSELKRNGLIEEIRYRNIKNYYDKREQLPALENTYRNIRFAMEASKDFASANDFFVGEMEARRKQLSWYKRWFFSVPAIYKLISHYGTSPARCGVFFLLAVMCHTLIISYLASTSIYSGLSVFVVSLGNFNIDEVGQWFSIVVDNVNSFLENGRFMDSFTYSIQTMTLQKDKVGLLSPESLKLSSVSFVNAMFTLIGPVLIGLLALTVRTRIKRN